MLIFEHSHTGRRALAQAPQPNDVPDIPDDFLRTDALALPEVSEMQVVRHYTRLSQKNFSIDTQFYPLGSCTMKYNPRACNTLAMLPGFLARHPHAPVSMGQGFLACMYELQEILKDTRRRIKRKFTRRAKTESFDDIDASIDLEVLQDSAFAFSQVWLTQVVGRLQAPPPEFVTPDGDPLAFSR